MMNPASVSILIIDDNLISLKLMRVLLASEGYQVQTAVDAESALELLKTYKPKLILTDLQLPGMDGLAMTRLIKADPETKHIVVVAVTAYAMKGDEQKAKLAGCVAFITKPIDTNALPILVAGYLKDAGSSKKA